MQIGKELNCHWWALWILHSYRSKLVNCDFIITEINFLPGVTFCFSRHLIYARSLFPVSTLNSLLLSRQVEISERRWGNKLFSFWLVLWPFSYPSPTPCRGWSLKCLRQLWSLQDGNWDMIMLHTHSKFSAPGSRFGWCHTACGSPASWTGFSVVRRIGNERKMNPL